jgi:hypothetical protein
MHARAATVAVAVLAACSRPPAPAATTGTDVASATIFVDSFLASLSQPGYTGDAARFDTAGFVWARSGALLDADSLTALLHAQRAAGKAIVLGTNDVQLTPLGPDAVVWSGIVSGVVTDSTGTRQTIRGALTLVLRRHGGAWVIAAGHESVRPFDDVHEAATAAPP